MKSVYGVGGVAGVGSPTAMNALLASQQFVMADLFTFTLSDASALRYTSGDGDLTVLGNVFSSVGPFLTRGPTRSIIGLEVDTLEINFLVNSSVLIGSVPLAQFASAGGFDGARLALWRTFMATYGDVSAGYLIQFVGRVADLEATRTGVRMNVNSDIELLNVMLPRNVYQAGCRHKLYDAGCSLTQATFTTANAAAGGSTRYVVNSTLAQADNYFDLGVIAFTSGVNSGLTRTVKSYANASGAVTLAYPLRTAPTAGDTFDIYPGCDKTSSTCDTKFSNVVNFGGFPTIPAPETAY